MKKSKPAPEAIIVIAGILTFGLMLLAIVFMAMTDDNNPYPSYHNTGEIKQN